MASHTQPIPVVRHPVDQSLHPHASLPSAPVPPPPPSSGTSTRGNLVAVSATVSDFVGVGVKERTWWHLRHLQKAILPGSATGEGQEGDADEDAGGSSGDGGMVRVAHCVLGQWPGGKQAHSHRKAKRGPLLAGTSSPSFSTSSSPSPALVLTTALASSASSAGSGSATTPTLTTLDFDVKTASPSMSSSNVDEDDLRAMVLMPSTQVFFVYEVQRIVFCLHMSRSLFCFQGGVIPAELMESTLANALKALVVDTEGKTTNVLELSITILACNLERGETHTLVQGYPLCRRTLSGLLNRVSPFLSEMENLVAMGQQEEGDQSRGDSAPRAPAFDQLVERSLFALQFLPGHAAPSIVLMVDGMFQLGHAAVAEYDDLIMQLCREDVVLSIVCLAPLRDPTTALGYVGDVQTLETAIKTTGGCVMRAADVDQSLAAHAETVPLRYMLAHHAMGMQDMLQVALLVRHSRLNVPLELAAKSSSSAAVVSGAAAAAAAAIAALPMSQSAPTTPFTTTRDKLKMYCLPLLRLRMLMELRAAEGFQATVVHLGGAGRAAGRTRTGRGEGSGGKVKQRRVGILSSSSSSSSASIAGTTVLVRLTRFLDCNLSVEYTLEYCPLAAGLDLGGANVTIDVVGSTDWIRAMTDPHACHEADGLRQSLRRFLRALQDRDFRLCRVMTLLKPQPKVSPASGGALLPKQARREEQRVQHREVMLWLGQLPLRDWTRWLHVTYFELVTLGEETAEARGESDGEEADSNADIGNDSPGRRRQHGLPGKQQQFKRTNEHGEMRGEEDGEGADLSSLRVREDLLLTLLARWCTFRAGRDLFVKALEGLDSVPGQQQRNSLRFVLLRLTWASDHVVRLHLGFFGVEGPSARQVVWELQKALVSTDGPLLLPKEPLAFQLLLPFPGRNNLGLLPHYPAILASDVILRSYLKCRRWSWHLGRYTDLSSIMDTLARAQAAAGFTLVHKDRQQTLLVQHVALSVMPGDEGKDPTTTQQHGRRGGSGLHGGASTAAATRSALVQYRVLVEAPHGLTTEIWMEPQHGFGAVGDHRGPVPEGDVWQKMAASCYEQDRRLISAMDSFLYIRHLCTDAHPGLGPTAARDDPSPRRPACAPHDLNLLEVLRGAEKTELTLRLFLPLAPDQVPLPIGPCDKGKVRAVIDGDENNCRLHLLTERTLRTLLGTEIPAGSLNAAAKGEEDAAYQARRQGQDLLWKVELGLTGWREGKCFAHQVSDDALSIWFLEENHSRGSSRSSSSSSSYHLGSDGGGSEGPRPQMVIKIFIITFQHLLVRLIGAGSAHPRGQQASASLSSTALPDLRAPSPLPADNPLLAYISYLHRRNFTQVAYMALRCGQPIAPADLRDALGYCSEIGMDVDMTHLRKVALATTDARQRIKDQAIMRTGGPRSADAGNDDVGADAGGEGAGEEEETGESGEVASQDLATPLGKGADREFQRAISSWLAPVPGTDFYFYVGSEEDLYEAENDSWEATRREGSAEDSAVTSSMAPPKIYMRKASDPGAFLGVSAVVSSKRSDGVRGSAAGGMSPTTKGIAGLFMQGYEAELGMMLKMLDVKRRAQARNLSGGRGHDTAVMQEDLTLVTPCFVRFEIVHALYGLAQSRVFRLTSTNPPSMVLPFCFDDAVAREDMWVAPRVSRQATSVSIICATHSRLDVAKFEAALEGARRQSKERNGEAGSPGGELTLSEAEAKDLMLTTHKRFLRLVRRRVEAWAAAETLRCLLSLSPLPTMAVPTILQCLRPLPTEAITRVNVTLAFVADLPNEAQDEEDSDDDVSPAGVVSMGSAGAGNSGLPRRGVRLRSHQSNGGMETATVKAGGSGGDTGDVNLSLKEQHEEEALELFHEHLSACRFLPVRRVAGVYFVVEPSLPWPTPSSQGARSSSSSCMSPPDRPSTPPTTRGQSPSSVSTLATCAYQIPHWVLIQVRRRKARPGVSIASAISKEDLKSRRTGSGGGGSRGDMRREEESVGGYVDSYEVVVSFHHPPAAPWYEERREVMENVRRGILAVCTHVNQIILLRHLHDTRHASPLLIAPMENDLRFREEMANDGMSGSLSRGGSSRLARAAMTARNSGTLPSHPQQEQQLQHEQEDQYSVRQVVGGKSRGGSDRGQAAVFPSNSPTLPFYPNQFKCPRQITLRFPVFHRLTPVAALRALESDVLHPLTVQNRVHTFVHRDRHGRVSYLRFEASRRKDSLTSSGHGVYGSSSGGDAPFGLDLDTSAHSTAGGASAPLIMSTSTSDLAPPQTPTTTAATASGAAAWIDCHVHGVDEVGEELSVHLHRLLESRLAEVSIFHLSELLSRNPRLQLTAQDLNLIKTGTATIPPSAAVAAMGGSVVLPPPPASQAATTTAAATTGGRYQALLELPGGLLRYGDPYLFLLYLRQNTARAQFINNIILAHGLVGGGGSMMGMMGSSMAATATSSSSLIGGGTLRPARAPSQHPLGNDSIGSISASDLGTFGSGRGIEGLSEVWAPDDADASTWHPCRIGFSGPRPLEPLSAATSHPAFWSLAGGVEVEIAPGLLDVYYNHNRPEVYEAGRKDVTTTLSSRGARLAKEVGKGLALVNVQPVDAAGNTVRRLRSAVSVTQEEINAVVVAAAATNGASGGGRVDIPLPWAVSILKPSTDMVMVPEAARQPQHESQQPSPGTDSQLVSPTSFAPPSSPSSSSFSYSWFQHPTQQEQQQQSPHPASESFSHVDGGAGEGEAAVGGGLWGIAVEILGSVNGEPLMQWLKLCVDQALHDYFIERLLAFMKNPPPPLSTKALPLPGPIQALREVVGDDAADDNTFAGRMHRALAPWNQLVASCLLLDSPSIRQQEGSEIIPRSEVAPLVQVVCRGMGQAHPFLQSTLTLLRKALSAATRRQDADLHLVDPQALMVAKRGNGDRCEYILLGGLRIGDVASSASSVALAAPTFASFNSRAAMNKSKSTESLPPADSLYPTLTTSEGATASMNALRMTNRDTACVVRVTAERQSLILYNCHPELAGRCMAAFGRALAFVALGRFVYEGVCLQKLGLLPWDLLWWRKIPGLPLEGSRGQGTGTPGMEAGKGEQRQIERGRARSDTTMTTTKSSPKKEEGGNSSSSSSSSSSRSSNSTGASDVPLTTQARQLRPEMSAPSVEAMQRSASHDSRKAAVRPEIAVRGGDLPPGMAMTPAMAARLRASRRNMPTPLTRGTLPSALRKPTSGASALSASGGGGAIGRGSSDSTSSSSTSSTPTTLADALGKRSASASVSSASDRLMLGKGVSSESGHPLLLATQESWLARPQEWMAALLARAGPDAVQASRQISQLLRMALPAVWSLVAFNPEKALAVVGSSSSSSSSNVTDPTRFHLRRLWESTLPYFADLEGDARLGELCHRWTWYQHFLLLQQRSAHLQSRVRQHLKVGGECTNAAISSASPQVSKSSAEFQPPLSRHDLGLLLRRSRWHGSGSVTLMARSFPSPSPLRVDSEAYSGSDSLPFLSPLLRMFPSPSPRPPSRSGAMTPALERRNTRTPKGSSPTNARSRLLPPPSPSSSVSSMTVASPSQPERPSSAAPFLELDASAAARRSSWAPTQVGGGRAEAKLESEDVGSKDAARAPTTDEAGPRFFSRSSTISEPPSRMMTRQSSRSSTLSDDQGLVPTLSSSYSSRRIGAWAEEDSKKQSFNDETTEQEEKEKREAAILAHDTLLREKEKEDFVFAKGFLAHYTSFLEGPLKMTPVSVMGPTKSLSSPSDQQGQASPQSHDWSSLRAYFHRFVALTNTVTLVEVQCEQRCVAQTIRNYYPGLQDASEVRVKISLYTLDIQATGGTSITNHNNPFHVAMHSGAGTTELPHLPSTHTFAWSVPGHSGGGGGLDASSHFFQQHAQLPQDVALSISQLELETQVYDYLVGYIMESLLEEGEAKRKKEKHGGGGDSILALLRHLFFTYPEPPIHAQTAIGIRFICQPVHETTSDPTDLLRHMQEHHGRYYVWPLPGAIAGELATAVVGAVSLKTGLSVDPNTLRSGSSDRLLFVLTVATPKDANDSAPGEFLLHIMHRKGNLERGQRGSFVEIPGHVQALVTRTLEAVSFDVEKEHLWDRVAETLVARGRTAQAEEAAQAASVVVMGGVPMRAPTPVAPLVLPPSPSPTFDDEGEELKGRSRYHGRRPSASATLQAGSRQAEASFTTYHLNTLLCYSAACQPLVEVDSRLAALFVSSVAEEDLRVPWMDVLSYLQHDAFWGQRAVPVEGLRQEAGEVDLLLRCDDDGEEVAGRVSRRGNDGILPNVRCLLHFSVRRRGQSSPREGQQGGCHPQEIVVQLIHREDTRRELTQGQRRHVAACIMRILGWLWLHVLAPEAR